MPTGNTLTGVAERIRSGEPETVVIKEFIDNWKVTRSPMAFESPPDMTGSPIIDTWVAGAAEALAFKLSMPPPAWSEAPERFLPEPVFLRNSPGGRMTELLETPSYFRRRNLFCGRSHLSDAD